MAGPFRSAVRIEGLTKRFGTVTAVDRLDLEVRAGEVLGFLGPNGAGKTTTIRLLMGFLRPSGGRAAVLGIDTWTAAAQVHGLVGYLPGDLTFPRGRTAADYLAWLRRVGQRPAGPPVRHDVASLAARLDLDLHRPLHTLSKGNRQKVGIVAALADDPPVLVLDEPTTGLDPVVQQEFHRLLREVAADGRSVLLSSHVLGEVQEVADRVGILARGHLLLVEQLAVLRERAAHHVTVQFAGPVSAEDFAGIPGVTDLQVTGRRLRATVRGEPDQLVKRLARHHVVDLSSREADLEETFLAYYGAEPPGPVAPAAAAAVGSRP